MELMPTIAEQFEVYENITIRLLPSERVVHFAILNRGAVSMYVNDEEIAVNSSYGLNIMPLPYPYTDTATYRIRFASGAGAKAVIIKRTIL